MWSVILPIVAFLIGGAVSYIFFKYGLKSRYDKVIKEAENEAEVIKKNKLLEVKEKFLNKKADLEKEVALRNQKIQQAENKLKQREMVLNQKKRKRGYQRESRRAVSDYRQEERRTRYASGAGKRETRSPLWIVGRRS